MKMPSRIGSLRRLKFCKPVGAIHLLCSFVSCGYIARDYTSCDSDIATKLDECKELLHETYYGSRVGYTILSGTELIGRLTHMCSNFPMLTRCVYNITAECPNFNVLPLLTNIGRTRQLCNGNVPVNWLNLALLTMDDIELQCVVPQISPSYRTCWKTFPDLDQFDGVIERESTTSFFRCVRTQLGTVASLQTLCGTSVRQVLLVQLVLSVNDLVLPSDEELNIIRLG